MRLTWLGQTATGPQSGTPPFESDPGSAERSMWRPDRSAGKAMFPDLRAARQFVYKGFNFGPADAIIKTVPAGVTCCSGDPNRNLAEMPKLPRMHTLLALAAAASTGSAIADPHAALRANQSTQAWECRSTASVGEYILPDDGSKPVTMTLSGHHGRNAGLIDMTGLPVIATSFGLRGLSLAWTWEEGSSAIYLKPDTGVASHYQFPDDETAVEPESSYICERTDDTGSHMETGGRSSSSDSDMSGLTPRLRPARSQSDEEEAFGLAVGNCWNVGSLSPGARATTVVVAFDMQRTGVPVTDSIRMVEFSGGSEADAGRAFEAARHAIIRCGRKGFQLPTEKYDQWRELEATFNAEGLRSR